jgi:hypothetical protein
MKRSRVDDDDFLRVEASDCPMSSCAAPAAVAKLAALLRDARPPPRNETGRRTTNPAA